MLKSSQDGSIEAMGLLQGWVGFALGSAFFAALTALLGKMGVTGINSNFATLIRTVVILAVTVGLVCWRHEWQRPATIPAWSWICLTLSGLTTGLSWLCYYRALQLGPVTRVAPIDKLSVVMAILLGALVLGEKLTWPVIGGTALIVAGSTVILLFK